MARRRWRGVEWCGISSTKGISLKERKSAALSVMPKISMKESQKA